MRQHDATDCGAACLDSVARFHGRRFPLSRIRQLAGTDQQGTSALGMIQAATRLGFRARGVKGTLESLPAVPLPAVAHVVIDGARQHFVVLYRVTRRGVVIMDPASGRVHRLSRAGFGAQWTGVLILLAPSGELPPAGELATPLQRGWALLRPHRAALGQALIGAVAYTVLGLSTAVYVQKIVDSVIAGGDRRLLNLLSLGLAATIALQAYLGASRDLLGLRTGQQIDASLVMGYYRHLLRLPQRFFDTMRVGELVSRVNDAAKVRSFLSVLAVDLVVSILVVISSFALMLLYSPRMALIIAAALPLLALVFAAANRLNRRNQRRLMESAADLEAQLVESISAMATIRQLGMERFAERRTEARLVPLLRAVYRAGTIAVFAGGATELLTRVSVLTLLWTGTVSVLGQSLSPGELMSLYALLVHLTGPVLMLVTANQAVHDASIAADRLFDVMALEGEAEGGVEIPPERLGDVCLQEVSFRYGGRARVFDGLTLRVPRAAITAVVGESGSGKTTLALLLQRVHPVDGGRILIGGHDLRHLSARSLRELIGVVPQRVDLFSGTVLENLAPGESPPDLDRVLTICDRLGLTSFVEGLPQGLHTPVGEQGTALSGGQRQRIAIARALYRRPRLLVLDEPTASLDPVSERLVHDVLRELRAEGVTVLLIGHRLSSVREADRIVVLKGGRVVEEGVHPELLQAGGEYHRLWASQYAAESGPGVGAA